MRRAMALLSVLFLISLVATLQAAEKRTPTHTSIQVTDMHCAACAKKIARKLYAVPGVVQVKTSLKAHTAFVKPEKSKQPDPLALWEAVEAAGFEPVKLVGPFGEFTSKEDLQR